MSVVKAATAKMSHLLAELAYFSESYWGYDNAYMEKFKTYYNVTKEFINKNPIFILKDDNNVIGFWALHQIDSKWELEYFYIAIQHIGKGYGRQLWDSLIKECTINQINNFEFVTSPQAVRFYEKMGAVTIDHIESLISKDRIIPKLRYTLAEK